MIQTDVTQMVSVNVGEQHDVNVAQPPITAAGDGAPGIVEDSHVSRIFEKERAVGLTEFPAASAQRSDCYIRSSPGRRRGEKEEQKLRRDS